MSQKISCLILIASLGYLVSACKKEKVTIPPAQVHFNFKTSATYQMLTSTPPDYILEVGTTQAINTARTVSFTVSSPTGAVEGTHYTIPSKTVTIPAGETIGEIDIKGIFDPYISGRKDTLIFTLQSGAEVLTANNVFRLVLRGPCFDGVIDNINEMSGEFPGTTEDGGSYGPYSVIVSDITQADPAVKKGTATIENLWDYFGPVDIEFDWTDPNNTIVNIPLQQTNQEYAAGQPFLIRTSPGKVSKFSICDGRLYLIVDIIVDNYPAPGSAVYYEREFDITVSR